MEDCCYLHNAESIWLIRAEFVL